MRFKEKAKSSVSWPFVVNPAEPPGQSVREAFCQVNIISLVLLAVNTDSPSFAVLI